MMEDLSLHILDIAENAIAAGATRIAISVHENEKRDILTIRVADNGRGMSRRVARRVLDPFFTTKGKRVGLGLPFFAQAADHCGGGLTITTVPGKGTKVAARFRHHHIDRPPLTAMAVTIMTLVCGHPEIDVLYRHRVSGRVFRFGSRAFLQGRRAPLAPTDALIRVKRHLQRGLKEIGRT
jgi:hypothetical protein